MKNVLVLALLVLLQSNPASALVVLVKNCQAPTAGLKITILDNQGIGPIRKSQFIATVADAQGNALASFEVLPPSPIQSVSFGRSPYTDKQTNGKKFTLAFPSTNFPHTSVSVSFPNGQTYSSDDVLCQ